MSTKTKTAAIEALLFAAGDAVELKRLALAIECSEEETKKYIEEMQERYSQDDRGISLIALGDSYQLCTKNDYYDELIKLEINAKKPHLTDVLLETLAIIAYKQPVTRLEIEQIRGVKSDHAVSRLIEMELVKELGRLDQPGRPILLGTSEEFLRNFGMSSPAELPDIDPVKAADLEGEAESEVLQKTVD